MQGMTLYQPWAWLIAHGYRTLDTRHWPTEYRGKLAIHAGRTLDREDCEALRALGVPLPKNEDLELGAVVAVAELVNVRPLLDTVEDARAASASCMSESDLRIFWGRDGEWTGRPHSDRWAFELGKVLAVRPTPWRGARGLWPVPPELLSELRAAYLALHGGAPA